MKFIKENWSAIIFTLFVHIVVLSLFAVNIDFDRQVVKIEKPVAVQAQVINGAAIEAEVKRQEQQDQDKLNEEIKRQKDLEDKALQAKKSRELEEKRLADLELERKKLEADAQKQKLEDQKKTDLEKKRLADLEKKRKTEEANLKKIKEEQIAVKKKAAEEKKAREAAEAKKQADLAAKKKADEAAKKKAAELAAKKKAEDEAKKKAAAAAEAKRVAELEDALASELAAEESFTNAVDSGAMNRYILAISQAIERNWRKPPSANEGLSCTLNVKQLPGGDVGQLSFGSCNGDQVVKDSIEQAVFRASPLPEPEDSSLFTRDLEIIFEPEI